MLACVGCCFVVCPSRQEADKAVNACHNKKTLPGVSANFSFIYLFIHFILYYLPHCRFKVGRFYQEIIIEYSLIVVIYDNFIL